MTTLPADELACAAEPLSAFDQELRRLRNEVDMLTKAGIIEVAVRNPSVAEYMAHWEGRALQAEAELSSLRAKLAEATEVVDAAKGLCFGEDWNKGSHAIKHGYRAKLISAIGKMFPDHPCAARRLIEGNGK